mmetsp:Transcript_19850/g.63268  ORF Transcript_19850/g.63268 Transcript_19850/m.63268 type:complete len:340 (+) Transcript_19850:305-1324(+)
MPSRRFGRATSPAGRSCLAFSRTRRSAPSGWRRCLTASQTPSTRRTGAPSAAPPSSTTTTCRCPTETRGLRSGTPSSSRRRCSSRPSRAPRRRACRAPCSRRSSAPSTPPSPRRKRPYRCRYSCSASRSLTRSWPGDMGRHGEIWGDMGKYGEIWRMILAGPLRPPAPQSRTRPRRARESRPRSACSHHGVAVPWTCHGRVMDDVLRRALGRPAQPALARRVARAQDEHLRGARRLQGAAHDRRAAAARVRRRRPLLPAGGEWRARDSAARRARPRRAVRGARAARLRRGARPELAYPRREALACRPGGRGAVRGRAGRRGAEWRTGGRGRPLRLPRQA